MSKQQIVALNIDTARTVEKLFFFVMREKRALDWEQVPDGPDYRCRRGAPHDWWYADELPDRDQPGAEHQQAGKTRESYQRNGITCLVATILHH